jgi:hypothetical protein
LALRDLRQCVRSPRVLGRGHRVAHPPAGGRGDGQQVAVLRQFNAEYDFSESDWKTEVAPPESDGT